MTDLFSLKGKRVLITGGTRGLGRAISLQFARAGASVLANYVRDVKGAELLGQEAVAHGMVIETVRADLSSEKGMETLVAAVGVEVPISALIHCAATGVHRPFEQLTLRHFDWTFGLNLRAFFDLVQRLLPRFPVGSSPAANFWIFGISSFL